MSNQFGNSWEICNGIISNTIYTYNIQDIIDYYITKNNTEKDTCKNFHFSATVLRKIMHYCNLKKPRLLSYEHNKKTLKALYGDEHYNNHTKQVETCLKKYGCENTYQAAFVKEKAKETKLLKYGDSNYHNPEKAKKTCLEKYGVEYTAQVKEFRERAKATCKKHFGVEYPMQSKEVQAKYNFKELSNKAFETKKKNGTTNSSNIQQWFINELQNIYGKENIETEYDLDSRYPYHCDVYVKPIDQFIELNIFFTHGKHPYNADNPEDIKLLSKWQALATISKFYKNAIRVWTELDVEKQNCAKRNNLNYLIFYTADEVREYVNKLRSSRC